MKIFTLYIIFNYYSSGHTMKYSYLNSNS